MPPCVWYLWSSGERAKPKHSITCSLSEQRSGLKLKAHVQVHQGAGEHQAVRTGVLGNARFRRHKTMCASKARKQHAGQPANGRADGRGSADRTIANTRINCDIRSPLQFNPIGGCGALLTVTTTTSFLTPKRQRQEMCFCPQQRIIRELASCIASNSLDCVAEGVS